MFEKNFSHNTITLTESGLDPRYIYRNIDASIRCFLDLENDFFLARGQRLVQALHDGIFNHAVVLDVTLER